MSSGLDLRVSRSLELLAAVRHTAAEFAQREDQFARDIRTRRYAANRKFQEAMEQT